MTVLAVMFVTAPLDAEPVAAHGVTVVRVPFEMSSLEPTPGVFDEDYLDEYVEHVESSGRRGVGVIVSAHQDGYGPPPLGVAGMPAWMQDTDSVMPCGIGCPAGSTRTDPAVRRAFDNLWQNAPLPEGPFITEGGDKVVRLQDAYADMWQHVAGAFAGHPDVVGYDILDDPLLDADGPASKQLSAFYRKIARAIHAVDPGALIWLGSGVTLERAARST